MLIIFSRMEELVTLQHGNFAILGKRAREFTLRTSCSNRVADQTLRYQLFLNELRWEHQGWRNHLLTRVGSLIWKECCLHAEKRTPKVLLSITSSQIDGPWAPLCPDPFRVHRCWNTKDHQAGLQWECIVTLGVLPHQQHDECMRELHQELTKCMARAGPQGELGLTRPTARSRVGQVAMRRPLSRVSKVEKATSPL